jgi:restriction endonuclease S subunit
MSPAITDWVIRNSRGTSIPSISAKVLATLPLNLPPLWVQRTIAEMIDNFTENAAAHERAYQAATEMRDSLLPILFSGKI